MSTARPGSMALKVVQKHYPQVRKVTDADEGATLTVTPKDTKAAKRKDHNGCALAVAAKRTFDCDGVIVSTSKVYVVKGSKAVRFNIGESASREIVSFDRSGIFEEGDYTLRAPSKTERLGSIPYYGHDNRGTGKKRRGFRHLTQGVRAVLSGQKRRDE